MPELPDELFLESLAELIAVDREWVPPAGGEESLYLRPFMIATEVGLGVRPSAEYLYCVIASPAGAVLHGRHQAGRRVAVARSTCGPRSGGTGAAKFGGNYAASLLPQAQAAEHGCEQVVVARRRGAPLGRRDGRDEPVLRLRLAATTARWSPRADRRILPGRHPRLVAACWPRSWAARSRSARSPWRRVARGRGGRARSPRCSAAAPPRSITPIGRVQHARRRGSHRRRRAGPDHAAAARRCSPTSSAAPRRHPQLDAHARTRPPDRAGPRRARATHIAGPRTTRCVSPRPTAPRAR